MTSLSTTQKRFDFSLTQKRCCDYWLSLWDSSTGGFRFASHQPATLMATAYCILGLEFVYGLSHLSTAQKDSVIAFLMSRSHPDGSFSDPLFHSKDVLGKEQGSAYFQEETTTFCQQALDALKAPPPPPRVYPDERQTVKGVIQFCESLPWSNAWLDSNPVMFLLSQICHDAERHQKPEMLHAVDTALDWLDDHQSSETGLWQGPYAVSLANAMAATFHFVFFYGYRQRSLRHEERIIDSCLNLQRSHGLFGGDSVGHTCLDYDAIELLAKASSVTDYRSGDIQEAMVRAYNAILKLHNADGGFAHRKERVVYFNSRKARLLRKIGLSRFAPSSAFVPEKGTYSVCWKLLSCEVDQSNAFSTWFRLISLCLAKQHEELAGDLGHQITFRRLPFLGYH